MEARILLPPNREGDDIRSIFINQLIKTALDEFRSQDKNPLRELQAKNHDGQPPSPHKSLVSFIDSPTMNVDSLRQILKELGTTTIQVEDKTVLIDNRPTELSFVRATGAEATNSNDDMTNSLWIRDQAFIAAALLEEGDYLNDKETTRQGKKLLLSLLDLMTLPSQIERFDDIISRRGIASPEEHPLIKFDMQRTTDGIALDLQTDWNHNQDAWQILAYYAVNALENGFIPREDILPYREFFERIPNFFYAVDYLNRPSKGSWEEICAKGRFSTIVWEWSLLFHLHKNRVIFGFTDESSNLMRQMIQKGAQAIVRRFPDESTELHTKDDPAYRKEDAALLYVGLTKTPELLLEMEKEGFDPVDFSVNPIIKKNIEEGMSLVDATYVAMFETISHLKDPITKGMARYKGDSYQASCFWLDSCWNTLASENGLWLDPRYKDDNGIINFVGREILVNILNREMHGSGYETAIAGWMHPNLQAASIAFNRVAQTSNPVAQQWFWDKGLEFFKDALSMITNENAWTIRPGITGMELYNLPPGIAPECIVTNILQNGEKVIHYGPWGPLFWTAACLRKTMVDFQRAETKLNELN